MAPRDTRVEIEMDCVSDASSVDVVEKQKYWERHYEQEGYLRLTLCVLGAAFGLLLNAVVQAFIHDQARNIEQLPDLFFVGEPQRWAENVMNWVVLVTMIISAVNALMHQFRIIVVRRVFFALFVLYVMRAVTLAVTPLPPSYGPATRAELCEPAQNITLTLALERIWAKVASLGQNTAGLCGDMLFSGHTMLCTTCVLFTQRYSPRRFKWPLTIIQYTLLVAVVILLVISRSHYTIDIVIGYWLTLGFFVYYHSFVQTRVRRRRRLEHYNVSITWMLHVLESHLPHGRVPNGYNLPWACASKVDACLRRCTYDAPNTPRIESTMATSVTDVAHLDAEPPTDETPLRHSRQSSAPTYGFNARPNR